MGDSNVVRVTLQCGGTFKGSRGERRTALARIFTGLSAKGIDIDLGTISINAQTVEASLDARDYRAMRKRLEADGIRVDEIIDRKIVD